MGMSDRDFASTTILSTQKGVLKEILRFYKVVPKWVKWNFANKYGVYAYIRSMGRDRVSVENTHIFFATTTPRRWTAIGMGADRHQTAIGSLSTAGVPLSPILLGFRAPGHHAH